MAAVGQQHGMEGLINTWDGKKGPTHRRRTDRKCGGCSCSAEGSVQDLLGHCSDDKRAHKNRGRGPQGGRTLSFSAPSPRLVHPGMHHGCTSKLSIYGISRVYDISERVKYVARGCARPKSVLCPLFCARQTEYVTTYPIPRWLFNQ